MLNIKKHIIIFVLICILSISGMAQTFNLEQISIEQGLSQSAINCMITDKQGFIWTGTQDGLNKFDGYSFTVYRHDPTDRNSISDNYIRSICEDFDGNIWVCTQVGLNMYDKKRNIFVRYTNDLNNPKSISDNDVYCVIQSKDSLFWIKTGSGFEKFNRKKDEFTHYLPKNNDFTFPSEYNTFDIQEDTDNKIWVGTKDGVSIFSQYHDGFIKHFEHDSKNINSLSHNEIRAIYLDNEKNIWIGTQNGLNKYDRTFKNFKRYYYKNKNAYLKENVIRTIFEDYYGNIWVGTEAGIKLFDRKNEQISDVNNKEIKQIEQRVSAIFEDRSKILWFGTWNGIFKADRRKRFTLYNKENYPALRNLEMYISSIYVDDDNLLWLGTRYTGLYIINRETWKVYSPANKGPYNNLPEENVSSIYNDKNNVIWVGTSNGLFYFDRQTKTFVEFFSNPAFRTSVFRNNRIYSILQDNKNNYWIGTQNGLYKISNNIVKLYNYSPTDPTSISSDEIYSLYEDSEGSLWIGTLRGLNRYNPDTDNFEIYYKTNNNKGLSNNSVLSIYEDSKGTLWFGTESGLNKFNKKDETFIYYTQKNGFKNDYIYSILEDDKGFLWLSTNRGIARFNPIRQEVTTYEIEDNLQSYEFNLGSRYKSANGELFFGGIKGLNAFFADSISASHNVPKVTITGIEKINNQGNVTQIQFQDAEKILLEYNENSFTINFATLEYTNPKKNQYQYRLLPLQKDYITEQNQHSATFLQLSPGTYTFEVFGSNSDKVWNFEPTTITIIIRPPFWQTNLAYFIYIVSIIGLLYLLIMLITKNMRKENQILQEKQKSAIEIAKQKEELSIKNQSITDSINYAKRIIVAMVPSENYFKKLLPESFILHMPKDIVSGDFYWISQSNDKIYVAAVDCTGHGVPGAFMSIIGMDLFKNILSLGYDNPADILNKLNREVSLTFKQESDQEDIVKDGMDLAFCAIDRKSKTLEYSGAFNPIYIIRDNNIIEMKPDRFSLGLAFDHEEQNFTCQTMQLQENDIIYMFSDGYSDQFGGEAQRKFKFRRFRHLLLTIHQQPPEIQKSILKNTIIKWMAGYEQVDDILVIGIKPLVSNT